METQDVFQGAWMVAPMAAVNGNPSAACLRPPILQSPFSVGVQRARALGRGGGGSRAGSRARKGRKHIPNHHFYLVKVAKSRTCSLQHSFGPRPAALRSGPEPPRRAPLHRPPSTYSPPSFPHAGDGGASGVGGALEAALARPRRASPPLYFTLTPSLLILIYAHAHTHNTHAD